MKIKKYVQCIMLLQILFVKMYAQSDSSQSVQNFQVKTGVFYQNGLHFYGRTDSIRSSALLPLAEIWYRSKIFVQVIPVFTHSSIAPPEYAGTIASAGYQSKSENEKWLGSVTIAVPLYRSQVTLPQAAVKADLNTMISWRQPWFHLSAGAGIRYSDQIDYGFQTSALVPLRKSLPQNWTLIVLPGIQADAGTQRFTHTIYKERKWLLLPLGEEAVTETANRFAWLSYSASVPLVLTKNKIQLITQVSFTQPLNLIVQPQQPEASEQGKSIWSFTTGFKYSF